MEFCGNLMDTVFNVTYRCCLPCTRVIGWTDSSHSEKIVYKHEHEQNGQPPWMVRYSQLATGPNSTHAVSSRMLSDSPSNSLRTPLLVDSQHVGLSTPPTRTSNGLCTKVKTPSSTSRRGSAMSAATEEALKAMSIQEHYELGYQKASTSGIGAVRGQLKFALRYDFIHRVLMVHVLNCQNLVSDVGVGQHTLRHDSHGLTDPYLKMYLLPERRHHCKTKIHRRTVSPEFNEMFSFDVAYSALPNRMLQFNAFDFDRFTRHDLLGTIIMRDLFEKSDLYHWTEYTMHIISSSEKNDFGDLLLYLSYSRPDSVLVVTVAKAYNLRPMDITGASDPYVKIEQIYQNQRIRKRRTTTKRANLNPVYHEILEFEMDEDQMEDTFLLVQVIDWDRIGKDDLLGCCILGVNSPTVEGRTQWREAFTLPPSHQNSIANQPNHNLLISLDPPSATTAHSSTYSTTLSLVAHTHNNASNNHNNSSNNNNNNNKQNIVTGNGDLTSITPDLTVTSGHLACGLPRLPNCSIQSSSTTSSTTTANVTRTMTSNNTPSAPVTVCPNPIVCVATTSNDQSVIVSNPMHNSPNTSAHAQSASIVSATPNTPPTTTTTASAGYSSPVRPMRHSVIIPKPKAVGKWHSLLPEIPDQFRTYNKK